jgi:predicted double-glycine peptidase
LRFAHSICCGVRQSGSKSCGLATTITVLRARLVAT